MTATPPSTDTEALDAIAHVLGQPTTTDQLPPPPAGGNAGSVVTPDPPSPGATTPSQAGPTSIMLRPKGPAAPVVVTRRHLYTAITAAILTAALISGLVAAVVAGRNDPAPTPTATTTTTRPTTSTSTSTSTTTTTAPPPVVLDPATLTLPVPRTPTAPGPYGSLARPGELILIPEQINIATKAGTAQWQWQTCDPIGCRPIEGATGDGYQIPAGTPPGTAIRAALTATPQGQTGRITVYTQNVTIAP